MPKFLPNNTDGFWSSFFGFFDAQKTELMWRAVETEVDLKGNLKKAYVANLIAVTDLLMMAE